LNEYTALMLALGFGVMYNWAFARWASDSRDTVWWVVGGVAATLIIASAVTTPSQRLHLQLNGARLALTNAQHAAFHVFKFFVATGLPMGIGALYRGVQRGK
jgi:hypothetical protein